MVERKIILECCDVVIGEWGYGELLIGDKMSLPEGKYRVDGRRQYSDSLVIELVKISDIGTSSEIIEPSEPQPQQKELELEATLPKE